MRIALQAIGVGPNSWKLIEQKASRGVEPFASRYLEAQEACAQGTERLLGRVEKASRDWTDKDGVRRRGDWKAAVYLAEKGDPELARAPVQAHALLTVQGEPVQGEPVDLSTVPLDELYALYRLSARSEGRVVEGELLSPNDNTDEQTTD